jgi:hypothetical protein
MSELEQGPLSAAPGQPASTPSEPEGTPVASPEPDATGQAPQQDTATGQAPIVAAPESEPSFFDIKQLAPELLPAYKQMQGAFTKRMQEASAHRQKIEAYDAFMADPVGNLMEMSKRYGLNVGPVGGQPQGQPQQTPQDLQTWEPQSWKEVIDFAKTEAKRELMTELQPMLGQVQQMRAQTIETQLNEIDPAWRTHEDAMRKTLQKHPTMVNDVAELYKLSVPNEVLEARATQAALARFEKKAQASKVATSSGTSKSTVMAPKKGVMSFDEAVEAAKEQCRQEGTYR